MRIGVPQDPALSDRHLTASPSHLELLRQIAGLLEQIWRMQQKHDADLAEIARLQQILLAGAPAPPPRPPANDPIVGHKALECSGFPLAEQDGFIARWQARPVIRSASAGRSVVTMHGATDGAMMWILLAANDADRYPIVLSPAAYRPGARGQSRAFAEAVMGIFDVASAAGQHAVMDRPALATPAHNDLDTFVIARAGVVRA
jgi:hypothetical protein